MKLSKYTFSAALLVSLFITGCGTPYKDKGYKSEADYEFSNSANLSPIGVARFKAAGVSSGAEFNAAINEMRAKGYSNSSKVDDVLEYVRDRFEGAKVGISALDIKRNRDAEAAQLRAKKIEAEKLEAKKKADENAAKVAAEKAKKDALDRKLLESKSYVSARRQALLKEGVVQANLIDLMVDFKSLKGKKVFLVCNIYNVDSSTAFCRSDDEKHLIIIESPSINRSDYRTMLKECSERYYNQNHKWCQSMPIVATVAGSSTPRLINASVYELCKERRFNMLRPRTPFDECYVE